MREYTENYEKQYLSNYAALSTSSKGRVKLEKQCPVRTNYARDRDRIIHSASFRRLKHKTQVFLSPLGDHYRTRLTHTLEVSQIARTVSRALRLNEDLTEAIALGHDLGHTPFGHAGERALNETAPFSFQHSLQSVRVVDRLEKNGKGLNLTYEVKNGIACHCSEMPDAKTLEGKVVEYADKIAYINHDIEDAIRAGILKQDELPYDSTYVLGRTKSQRITTILTSMIRASDGKNQILMEAEVYKAHLTLRSFMFEYVYHNSPAQREESKAQSLLQTLYRHFITHPDQLPDLYQGICEQEGADRAVCDYIASMTDVYATHLYQELYIPNVFIP